MRRRTVFAIVVGVAAAADVGVGCVSCSQAPRDADVATLAARAVPLDLDKPYARDDYRFLDAAVGSASIVQLGESMHITEELPRIRLRFLQYLHEQLGFDTIAFEGSLTQAWIAQEYLYKAKDIAGAQEVAWFPLWVTPAMREVLAYVASTLATPHPMYLTSFDVQVGQSKAFGGDERVVVALFDALRSYHSSPIGETDMLRGLTAIVRCGADPDELAANRDAADKAVSALDGWIRIAVPSIQPATHATALAMVPQNFRDLVELCTHWQDTSWQQARDELNARGALAIRDRISPAHKIALWAHHSHVNHNSTGHNTPSMGQHLRDKLGRELYTVGTFVGGGRVVAADFFGERGLPPLRKFGVERMLAAVDPCSATLRVAARPDEAGACDPDAYFIDLATLPTSDPEAGWLVEQRSRMESIPRLRTVLAKDFDGAIYVDRVHPAALTQSTALRWLLRIWGFVYEHAIAFAILIVAAIGFAVRAIVRRIVRAVRSARIPAGT